MHHSYILKYKPPFLSFGKLLQPIKSLIMRNFILIFISVYALSAFGIKAQGMGFIPNKGQVYDQKGAPNTDVVYLLREGAFQLQLRKGGFSYEIFKKNSTKEKSEEISRLDLAFKYAYSNESIEFNW
jgi:hypothetical protein